MYLDVARGFGQKNSTGRESRNNEIVLIAPDARPGVEEDRSGHAEKGTERVSSRLVAPSLHNPEAYMELQQGRGN